MGRTCPIRPTIIEEVSHCHFTDTKAGGKKKKLGRKIHSPRAVLSSADLLLAKLHKRSAGTKPG